MRLYSLTDATGVDYGGEHYKPGEDGAFDFPDELSSHLHGFAAGGRKQWETDIERQHRLVAEELERRKDPATLLDAVQQLVRAAESMPPQGGQEAPKGRTAARSTAAAKK